jgi:diphthamide synthase (EF-2-diphthine--ammonia ligase)
MKAAAHDACQTPAPRPILLSWSGGKDSAWALHLLRRQPQYKVVGLLTSINEKFRRVAIHGFREELLDQQAAATGLPLWKVDLPFPCSNADYESRMAQVFARAVAQGIRGIAFGDLFLADIRAYRIAQLAPTGLEPIFPVWCADLGISTAELAQQMLAAGLRAYLTCIDPRVLDRSFAGRTFDAGAARRSSQNRRSLRRTRRVPYLRLRRPHVLAYHLWYIRADSGARQFHLCRDPPRPRPRQIRPAPDTIRPAPR